jgi:hypothetical protein
MRIDDELILQAAIAIKRAYQNPDFNVNTTEWSTGKLYPGISYIAIAGTNDWLDWFWNLALLSRKGVKLGAYVAAQRIKKYTLPLKRPLLVCGHSKAGPTAIYLGKLLNADYSIAFNPAPGFRGHQKFDNSLVITDPDDIVHKLGTINFNQPDCEVYKLPNDKKGIDLADHSINNVIEHFNKMLTLNDTITS